MEMWNYSSKLLLLADSLVWKSSLPRSRVVSLDKEARLTLLSQLLIIDRLPSEAPGCRYVIGPLKVSPLAVWMGYTGWPARIVGPVWWE